MGDSNLSRIPVFKDSEIQIDSFLGAKLYHIYELVKKLQPHPKVREVIFSIGLNNCLERLLPKTIEKQLALLTSVAKQISPNATIRIPIINFSTSLDPEQKQTILNFNKLISSKYNVLSEINPLLFKVNEIDNIHWTSSTAEKILQHWKDQLNF